MKHLFLAAMALLTSGFLHLQAQCDCPPLSERSTVVVADNGSGTGTTTWTCDNVYLLDGYVFVNSGQTLTIEPGTVVKGMAGQGADAAALIVSRGGVMDAEGTADCGITFTFEADDLDGSTAYDTRGQWGGVIVLGDAPINLPTGEGQIEGIPADNDRAAYGGTNANDNSGILRYFSIRHGGTQLGAANEINGLTLGGVGAGTTIDHIEVISNDDDGIEFFGGTVEVNYAAVAFVGDDSFDWDQGYAGGGSFWFSINDANVGDRGGELDGDDSPDVTADGMPFTIPAVTNWTMIGRGIAAGKQGMNFRAGSGGHVSNSIIANFAEGIELEDVQAPSDAFDKWVAGDLTLSNIEFDNVSEIIDYDGTAVADGDAQLDAYAAANNLNASNTGMDFDWSANASGTAFTNPFNPAPTTGTNNGAFINGNNWLEGSWSYLDVSGAAVVDFGNNGGGNGTACDCPPVNERQEITISDTGFGTGSVNWTCDKTYLLDGYVFVNNGQALTIEAGTVIKGMPGQGADAAALIVARGGQIFAEGSADCPIIFTFEGDPLDGSVAYNLSNQWGGVVICGDAPTNLPTGEGQVEGIPSTNDRAKYGGNNADDNSGVFRYVSIRHGGTQLGAANEINGLTLAGVGAGTTMDHIEVIANEDDGIEFFGGNVQINYAAVAFAGDDSFDWDQGFSGGGHHWFSINDAGAGDRGGELDGDDSPDVTADGQPFAIPTVSNWTMIGRGVSASQTGMLFRAGSGGHISDAIIVNYAEGIEVEDKQNPSDAYDKWIAGDLTFANFRMQGVAEVIDYDGIQVADGDVNLDNYAAANNMVISNVGIDADWSANATGTAFTNPFNPVPNADVASTGGFGYMGAFDPNGENWLGGWSFLDNSGAADIDLADEGSNPGETCDCPPLAQRNEIIISESGEGTGTVTWTCDNTYLLDNYVFVNSGQVLTIEPGTVIKGLPGQGADAAALIVARGGQIFADGTQSCPITFTFEADPLDGSVSYDTRGQWGGVIVLGDASTNLPTGEGQVEGIPADNDRSVYGGTNDADNSGVLRYVSIRHGGTQLGAANEINGLTLGGVGNGTTIEHIEVVSNEDDGIEFFGGTVDVRYASVMFVGDDSFDWDQGYRGRGQFWFAIQGQDTGDRGGELDGDDSPDVTADGQPFTIPTIANWTVIGRGANAGNQGWLFRAGSGGHISNAIIANFDEAIEIEDKQNPSDAYDKWVAGDLSLLNIAMDGVSEVIDYDGVQVADGDAQLDAYATSNNLTEMATGIDYNWATNASGTAFTNSFNPVPNSSVNLAAGSTPTDAWFMTADYMGAFDPNGSNWLEDWTYASDAGALEEAEVACDCPALSERNTVVISDASGLGTGTTTWTCDNTYLLDGFVFVNSGQALTIEAGTVIKGLPGQGADAAALIVARGGQIYAEGTETCPITFTFEADPLDGSVSFDTRGQWGGVIVLGDATTNLPTGEGQIEGIPSDNDRAAYGGNNDEDNSGVLRYVSIRHGGTQLGAANEINGLTLGGVGRGTTIEYIEVIANDDDGIEFFGGAVDVKHAAVAFVGDDSFDYDQGYHGRGQYWFSINAEDGGDRAGEFDGDDSPDVTADGQPFATPVIFNATFVGRGVGAGQTGLLYRAGAGGEMHNAIIANYAEGIEIEDKQNPSDAYDKWVAGMLNLKNISMVAVNEVIDYDGNQVADGEEQLDAYAAANSLILSDPGIDFDFGFDATGVTVTNTLDLTPANDVTVGASDLATDDWFDAAAYRGAFGPSENWLNQQWSYLGQVGIFAEGTTSVPGCTDATADNYNADATVEDGSCEYLGCTDATADNYDASANVDNGSCLYTGCSDENAENYDPQANTGDQEALCIFNGCTNPEANNYNEGANSDDGSCSFDVNFHVDMWHEGGEAMISGDFTADASVEMTYANYAVYQITLSLTAGTYNFGYLNAAGEADGVARTVVVDSAMELPVVCFGSEAGCDGCTDPEFVDFNPHADASIDCTIAPVLGCTYGDATNFDSNATIDDGTCAFEIGNACQADLNGDGTIGTPDLLAFLSSFGSDCE